MVTRFKLTYQMKSNCLLSPSMIHKNTGLKIVLTVSSLSLLMLTLTPFAPNQILDAIESDDRNTATNAVVTSDSHDIEIMIFHKVNEERKKYKINLLQMDSVLRTIARQHSIDMANNCSLTHSTLGRRGPSPQPDQQGTIRKEDQPFVAAENIGMMPVGNVLGYGLVSSAKDVADAMMNRWMKSTSHQANILSKDYNFIGVGVAYDGSGAYYLTQNFK